MAVPGEASPTAGDVKKSADLDRLDAGHKGEITVGLAGYEAENLVEDRTSTMNSGTADETPVPDAKKLNADVRSGAFNHETAGAGEASDTAGEILKSAVQGSIEDITKGFAGEKMGEGPITEKRTIIDSGTTAETTVPAGKELTSDVRLGADDPEPAGAGEASPSGVLPPVLVESFSSTVMFRDGVLFLCNETLPGDRLPGDLVHKRDELISSFLLASRSHKKNPLQTL